MWFDQNYSEEFKQALVAEYERLHAEVMYEVAAYKEALEVVRKYEDRRASRCKLRDQLGLMGSDFDFDGAPKKSDQ